MPPSARYNQLKKLKEARAANAATQAADQGAPMVLPHPRARQTSLV
jgi:hypothetical protein